MATNGVGTVDTRWWEEVRRRSSRVRRSGDNRSESPRGRRSRAADASGWHAWAAPPCQGAPTKLVRFSPRDRIWSGDQLNPSPTLETLAPRPHVQNPNMDMTLRHRHAPKARHGLRGAFTQHRLGLNTDRSMGDPDLNLQIKTILKA